MNGETLYREAFRPQFHFTPKQDWMNDPNGLVHFQGEYHLFFQHTPGSLKHGPNTWGHAVSTDLVHWTQLHHAALDIDDMGWIWSGSAVVDWRNSAGFQMGDEPPLVAFYTVGDTRIKPEKPCTQCIAFSNDRGRTWTKYGGNPVLGHIQACNRDPKVVWHEPSNRWIMVLFLDANDYTLYASHDLKTWTHLHDLTLPGVSECPDLFELPVDGNASNKRWVFWGGNGGYLVGHFDGSVFLSETDVLRAESGTNGYAAQTWSDIPSEDGRRIQISWMAGGQYPNMPFNQQMSFPVELALRSTPDGVRLSRKPVREISFLHRNTRTWQDHHVRARERCVLAETGDLFDVRLEIDNAGSATFDLTVQGHPLTYDGPNRTLDCLGKSIALPLTAGRLALRLLIDRTSLEVFADDGIVSMSFCFLPQEAAAPLVLRAGSQDLHLRALTVNCLDSSWTE